MQKSNPNAINCGRHSTGEAPRPPGMHDVAKLAQVSHQTVSRVLNNQPNVRPETRLRVRIAIAELGYVRNVSARTLVTSRSSTIGVVTTGSPWLRVNGAFHAVERAARQAGYYVSVTSMDDTEDPSQITDILQYFSSQGVDGIVIIAPEVTLAHAADPVWLSVPIVQVSANATPNARVHATSVDQFAGGRIATHFLLEAGHTDIAHVAGPAAWSDTACRVQGWQAELASAGLQPGILLHGNWSSQSGYRAGEKLLQLTLPSAVFVANDLMALGLIHALSDNDVRVPDDISVVGFDNMPGVENAIPPLTTIRQDFEALGQQCIALLLSAIGGAVGEYPLICPEIIIRDSVAGPRS